MSKLNESRPQGNLTGELYTDLNEPCQALGLVEQECIQWVKTQRERWSRNLGFTVHPRSEAGL